MRDLPITQKEVDLFFELIERIINAKLPPLDIARVPKLNDRIMFRMSVLFGVWTEGDHRDWNAIKSWAKSLPPLLDKGIKDE